MSDTNWAKYLLSPQQEIDGKSLLLMQRSDVLTGLSIRLGPALKIYERHVKVLQRTHFLEYEDLWSGDSHDRQTMLHWPKHACSALSLLDSATHLHIQNMLRVSGGGGRLRWNSFTVRMTRNWKTVILPLIMVVGFQMVFISPMWPFACIVKGTDCYVQSTF